MKFTLLGLCCFAISSSLFSQGPFELGGEYMKFIGKGHNSTKVAARGESYKNKGSFSFGITYQFASAKSYSVSTGFGIFAGYRYSLGSSFDTSNAFIGGRLLFSFENFEGKTNRNSLLLTPIAEVGYHFIFAKRIFTAPSLGFGYTFKFSKDYNSLDEDIGKRFIPSLSAGYRF